MSARVSYAEACREAAKADDRSALAYGAAVTSSVTDVEAAIGGRMAEYHKTRAAALRELAKLLERAEEMTDDSDGMGGLVDVEVGDLHRLISALAAGYTEGA